MKSVLISGATRGIGHACVRLLDDRGYRVFAGYRNPDDGNRVADEHSNRVTPLQLDVTKPHEITEAADRLNRELGERGLDGLVNNAGIVVPGPLEVLPLDELRRQFDVNVFGLTALTQAVLPLLRRARGRIVNVSSINGVLASPWSGAYAASKHALEALSDAWRVELRQWDIDVCVVQPGAVRTPIWETSRDRGVRISDSLSPAAHHLYPTYRANLLRAGTPDRAIPPEVVARQVYAMLTRRRPPTRRLVGLDARAGLLLRRLLPTRLLDWILGARRSV